MLLECKYRMTLKKKDRACIKHSCNAYIKIIGVDPQTGKDIDQYMCEDTAMIHLTIENSAKQIRTAQAIESLRNEVANAPPIVISNTSKRLQHG